MLKMPKKEELGYGIVIVFVLVSLFLVVLMVPFDTVTGAAVLDYSREEVKGLFYGAPFVDFVILAVVAVLIIGSSLAIIEQKKESGRILEHLPRMNRIELKEFVRENLEEGFKKEDIEEALLRGGWDKETVEAVLRLY